MTFLINQIVIGWAINLLLLFINYDSGNKYGTAFALAALVLAYFHESYTVGAWAQHGQGIIEDAKHRRHRFYKQTALFIGMICLLVASFIDYFVNA